MQKHSGQRRGLIRLQFTPYTTPGRAGALLWRRKHASNTWVLARAGCMDRLPINGDLAPNSVSTCAPEGCKAPLARLQSPSTAFVAHVR